MANYKNIADLELVTEASENAHVLVEDNGELKKMSAAGIGGGGAQKAYILTTTDGDNFTPNMSYAEFAKLYESQELGEAKCFYYDGPYRSELYAPEIAYYGDECYLYFFHPNWGFTIILYEDGGIEVQYNDSAT